MTNLELSRGAYEAARIAGNGRLDLRVDDGNPEPAAAVLRPMLTALSALVFPAALLGMWTLSSHFGWLPAQILPAPDQVAATLADLADSGDLWFHTRISLLRVVEGFALGGAAGLLLGIAMGLSRRVRWTVEPLFTALAQVPPLGWIPVLMLLVGIDEGLKLLIIAKAALIPVALNTHKGIRNVPDSLREVGSVLTFGPWATLTRIVLPAAVPSIFTGIRYGLTSAWLALVAVELLASSEGLGYLMVWGRQLFQLDMVIAAMLVVGLIGFALDWTLSRVERRLQRWELAGS
ncbi:MULTISPECIES: ABC transporter permease [unclassified Azospirillum]|uniref:ABC transporter permease n=1 Tax=unclassified Azospirillum TaxID=2630922 RepID=UPI0018EEA174|nr:MULTISPECIES: ABC transporter permease [unclassified Azospirillum]